MENVLLVIVLVVALISVALQGFLFIRKKEDGVHAVRVEIRSALGDMNNNINQIIMINSNLNQQIAKNISDNTMAQKHQLDDIRMGLSEVKGVIDTQLHRLNRDTNERLNQMREVVDEKLNTTLEKRLNESFLAMHNRLETLQSGLGEMKSLASGVVDLNKALSNTNVRGTWGEVQLEALLAQILAPGQFRSKQSIKGGGEQVDFVIVLPGKEDGELLLPIDAKFPIIHYTRIVEASEIGDKELVKQARKALRDTIMEEAKKISEKYINPPATTDFAVMYLPIEGLFAEVQSIDHGAIPAQTQGKYKVTICGPATLMALVNSLQMGFRTLAIEKRSNEVWQMLGIFKKEFAQYCELLERTQKQIGTVSTTLENATKKTRTIQRKLRGVEALGEGVSGVFGELDLPDDNEDAV